MATRILVVGAGAVGGYSGARLAKAGGDADVVAANKIDPDLVE